MVIKGYAYNFTLTDFFFLLNIFSDIGFMLIRGKPMKGNLMSFFYSIRKVFFLVDQSRNVFFHTSLIEFLISATYKHILSLHLKCA